MTHHCRLLSCPLPLRKTLGRRGWGDLVGHHLLSALVFSTLRTQGVDQHPLALDGGGPFPVSLLWGDRVLVLFALGGRGDRWSLLHLSIERFLLASGGGGDCWSLPPRIIFVSGGGGDHWSLLRLSFEGLLLASGGHCWSLPPRFFKELLSALQLLMRQKVPLTQAGKTPVVTIIGVQAVATIFVSTVTTSSHPLLLGRRMSHL